MRFCKVLLKLSGEALSGKEGQLDLSAITSICNRILPALKKNVKIGIVVGGGNLFRGNPSRNNLNIPRAKADMIGMLATIMNAFAVSEIFKLLGCDSKVITPFDIPSAEKFNLDLVKDLIEKGTVVVFGGGTGNPFFTTDTAAALRAAQIGCDILMKATNVDGVYDKDPKKDKTARRFDRLSFEDVLSKQLEVMDLAAVSLCRDNNIPIAVFNFNDPDAFIDICSGDTQKSTIIGGK